MKRFVVASVVACVALSACSGSSRPSGSLGARPPGAETTVSNPSATSTTTTLAAATAAQLNSELLKVTDLPTGWSSKPVSDSSSGGSFCKASNSFKGSSAAHVEADFAKGNLPIFDELIASFHTDIRPAFNAAVAALDSCTSFKDQGNTFTLGRMSFPTVGNESAAYSATGSVQGFNVGFDFIVLVKGNQAALMLYGDLGTPDVGELQQLVNLAVSKIP